MDWNYNRFYIEAYKLFFVMISNSVFPYEYNDPFWVSSKQIDLTPFDELKKVVNQLWKEEAAHFHFAPPSKNDTWEGVLQPALRCLKMLKTCENSHLTKDKDFINYFVMLLSSRKIPQSVLNT